MRDLRDLLALGLLIAAAGTSGGCSCGEGTIPDFGGGGQGGEGGEGGEGGTIDLPCGIDCAAIVTPACTVSVCNTGQELGPINTCVVVAAPTGTACDDGVFCTMDDFCDAGQCTGGPPNDCGLPKSPCEAILCTESTQTCSVAPVNDGTACTPSNLCEIDGVCQVGQCVGEPKDCGLSPLSECNEVSCDPATGQCVGEPDVFKDNLPCVLTGDPCQVDKACQAGECVGGVPKDCSAFDVACEIGACQPDTGICVPMTAPEGSSCGLGITVCQEGFCDAQGECKASAAPDGTDCNDHDSCTAAEECVAGACAGASPVAGCTLYFKDGFETCPGGWTLGGDWECGSPQIVGPPTAKAGLNVLATKVAAVYSVNQSFNTAVADSAPIDLTTATSPQLSFWVWEHTEGGSFDGWNLKISTNGGTTYVPVTTVSPPYPLTVGGQPSWGGDNSAAGWRNYQADLTAFAGQTVRLRFAFRSDAATVFPGVYLDDVFVAEPQENPLYVTTTSIPDLYVGMPLSVPLAKNGGTAGSVWSLLPGGTNDAWLSLDPATGVLSGTPTASEVGPVTFSVRVQEPGLPSNYDERTFTFDVDYASYYSSFEGLCPAGWTLTGTWQCGVPSNVGPPSAFVGTQVIATRVAANYFNSQTYTGATATSPSIDLSGSPFPTLTWRMWVETEGGTFDGVNLKISTDGGATYTVLDTVSPPYPLTIAGEPAWGGFQQGLGWQVFQANLAAYVGQVVRLRFSFRSDSSGSAPGIYVDDFLVQ
jgi:hypothetical protein